MRTTRKKKITIEAKMFIENKISNDVSITLQFLKNKLSTDLNIQASTTTIDTAIKELHYSFKRIHLIPVAKNG